MADGQLDRVIASLDARLGAAIARAEEEAADALAASLSHSGSLPEAASRLGPLELVLEGGGRAEVTYVGADYVGCGDPVGLLVPSSRATLRQSAGRRPDVRKGDSFALALLRWVRARVAVELVVDEGSVTGRVFTTAPDHVGVDTGGRRWIVGRGAIRSVRRLGGG